MRKALALLLVALAISTSAIAGSGDGKAVLFEAVTRCRAIGDPVERVACYDRSVEALQTAERQHEVTIVDRAQVRETKRSLFGLTLPRLPIFGGADDGQDIKQIESSIASVTLDQNGWQIRLADGSAWRQIDDVELGGRPKAGDKATVKRAALGSYRMTIAGLPGMKVRREV